MPKSGLDFQLKETGQLTRAYCAAWLEHTAEWELLAVYKIDKKNRERLQKYLQQPLVKKWLDGGLAGMHKRTLLNSAGTGLTGQKIYLFSDHLTQRIILVGADKFTDTAKRFWQVVALGNFERLLKESIIAPIPINIGLIPYHIPQALDRILDLFISTDIYQGGWLAVLSGDYLEIKAYSNCADCQGKRLSIVANPLLREITRYRLPVKYKEVMPTGQWPHVSDLPLRQKHGLVSRWLLEND